LYLWHAEIVATFGQEKQSGAIIDGEIVALDEKGRSFLQAL